MNGDLSFIITRVQKGCHMSLNKGSSLHRWCSELFDQRGFLFMNNSSREKVQTIHNDNIEKPWLLIGGWGLSTVFRKTSSDRYCIFQTTLLCPT